MAANIGIRGKQLADETVDTLQLAGDAVTNAKIADNAVQLENMADDSVDESNIKAAALGNGIEGGGGTSLSLTLDGSTLSLGASGVKINTNGVDSNEINADAVTSSELDLTDDYDFSASGSVTVAAPTNDGHAATKLYVDNSVQGLDAKQSVRAATTADGTLATAFANGQAIDGVTLATGDRILIKDQSSADENGIYTVNASGAPTRAVDMNAAAEFPGAFTFVEEGTNNDNTGWTCTVASTFIMDTDDCDWVQFSQAGVILAGDGMTKTGNTLDVVGGDGIVANADSIEVDLKASGGLKIDTAEIAVEPNDFAGDGLADDGSDNLKLDLNGLANTETNIDSNDVMVFVDGSDSNITKKITIDNVLEQAAGDGLSQGSGSLAVNTGTAANSGIETDSDNLRIAAAWVGNGLSGGGGSGLAVVAHDGITVDGSGVSVNPRSGYGLSVAGTGLEVDPADLVSGGSVEMDGDDLDITWAPSNYTRDASPSESATINSLTAHLKGIDNELASAGLDYQEALTAQAITGDTALTDTLTNPPKDSATVKLYLNGLIQRQGAGLDYTISGSTITWLAASGEAVDLEANDDLYVVYEYAV